MADPLQGFVVRAPNEDDHLRVLGVLDRWWAGALDIPDDRRERASLERALLLPRLFFQHFTSTSAIVERDGEIVAFLIAFLSQSDPAGAYVHFVGVDPSLRSAGVGRALYERFFATCRAAGRTEVRAITSPTNRGSIAFHGKMGFTVEPGDMVVGGVAAKRDYDGPGSHRVSFVKRL